MERAETRIRIILEGLIMSGWMSAHGNAPDSEFAPMWSQDATPGHPSDQLLVLCTSRRPASAVDRLLKPLFPRARRGLPSNGGLPL